MGCGPSLGEAIRHVPLYPLIPIGTINSRALPKKVIKNVVVELILISDGMKTNVSKGFAPKLMLEMQPSHPPTETSAYNYSTAKYN